MPKKKTKITYVNVDQMKPYDYNSRKHSDSQIKQIAKSISEFGFTNPSVVDDDLTIIAGHGRIEAAKLLNLKEVPCIIMTGLTDAQKRAYVIADNKISENSEWDYDVLKYELKELEEIGVDYDLLGFDQEDYDELFPEIEEIVSDKVNTSKHSIEDYEASNIRQIILVYGEYQYKLIVEALAKYCREKGLGSNTEAVTDLLEQQGYEVQEP